MTTRIIWFLLLLWTGLAGPWWLFLPLLAGYSAYYVGGEVIVVALMVDAAYGASSSHWPVYTVVTTIALLGLLYLQPRLQWYQN